jgi:hypothetical protein
MYLNASFGGANSTLPTQTFDQDTLQDVALACVEGAVDVPTSCITVSRSLESDCASGIVSALASNDTRRAKHIAERLASVLSASPLSLPSALECTCQRTMGCALRRNGDHFKAAECFKAALAQPGGEDAFQRVNTLMLLSNSLSSLQRCALAFAWHTLSAAPSRCCRLDLALDCALEAQRLLQKILFEQPHLMVLSSACNNSSAPVQMVRLSFCCQALQPRPYTKYIDISLCDHLRINRCVWL